MRVSRIPGERRGPEGISAFALRGIPEITPGDDLAAIVGEAIRASGGLEDGDILAVSSKIVSKAEGRIVAARDREQAITDETVRLVATRRHPGGVTRIVQDRNGFVMAAAGVDASNTQEGTILLLPLDPDQSARQLREALNADFGAVCAVVVTDTFGRPWRNGQTDVALGVAGLIPLQDLAGSRDAHGRELSVTAVAVADEVAAMADLVKGKVAQTPVALIRGLGHQVTTEHGPGARALVRDICDDMFSLGADEAWRAGFEARRRAIALDDGSQPSTSPPDYIVGLRES